MAAVLGAVLAAAGCGPLGSTQFADYVAWVEFDGLRYQGGAATGLSIDPADLEQIGVATDVRADVAPDVFALEGVDPALVIILPALEADESPYGIFFGPAVLTGDGVPPSDKVPGLCAYIPDDPCH